MRALVTGGAGFIGSAIATALLARGDEVRIFDSLETGFRQNLPEGAQFFDGDVRDAAAVREAAAGAEVIFHQAAIRSVPKSVDDPLASNDCNVTGTLNVLEAARAAGVRRVVYASSSSVYGDRSRPIRREDMRPLPASPYGVSKLAGELYCRTWTEVYGLSTVSLRYFNVYGPRQHPESKYAAVFPAFISALLGGRAPEIHWDGKQSRDFTFVEDVAAANLRAADAGPEADGKAFNIGAGHSKTVLDVLETVSDAVGRWIEPVRLPKRAGDVRHTIADITRAREVLGWEPHAAWTEAVKRTVVTWPDWAQVA